MTCVAPVHGYAIWQAENLSRFSFCLVTHRFKQLSTISVANRTSAKRSTTTSDWKTPDRGHGPQTDFWIASADSMPTVVSLYLYRVLARGLPSVLPIWRCNSAGKT
jgi:hypothetical protein